MIFEMQDAYVGLSDVASAVFSDVSPFMILVLGIVLGFFIIEILIEVLDNRKYKDTMDRADRAISDFENLQKK